MEIQPRRPPGTTLGVPSFRLAAILFVVSALAVWSASANQYGKGAGGTGGEFITMAYHLANGDGFANAPKSGGKLRPTNSREPAYPFYLAIGFLMSGTDLTNVSDSCLRNGEPPCHEALSTARHFNLGLLVATVLLTVVAVTYFCGAWPALAIASAVAIYWQGAVLVYAGRFMSENLILPALLLHAIFLAHAIARPDARRWAVLAGLALMLAVLTKAIFILYIAAGAVAVVALGAVGRVRRRPEFRQVVIVVLMGALAWGGWSIRNKVVLDDGRISGRGESILSWRAEMGTASWSEIVKKAVYYTPYYGEKIAESIFPPDTMERLHLDDSGGMRWRVNNGASKVFQRIDAFEGPRDTAKAWVPIQMILENWDKNIVLTPILIWRGFGMPTGKSWTNNSGIDEVLEVGSQILTVLLVPALFVAVFLAWRRREWPMFAFLIPFIFVVAAHATLTHYRQRFGVPVIPGGVVALCWLAMSCAERRLGRGTNPD